MNLYDCVLNDPVNLTDPLGLKDQRPIVVPGNRHMSESEVLWGLWRAAGIMPPHPDVQAATGEEIGEIVVTGRRSESGAKQIDDPCAAIPPAVLDYLSTRGMSVARGRNATSIFLGRPVEAGGLVTPSADGGVIATTVRYNNANWVNLPGIRSIYGPMEFRYDWHTHPGEGVLGLALGFSDGDVRTLRGPPTTSRDLSWLCRTAYIS